MHVFKSNMTSQIKAVLFDLDDTLFDRTAAVKQTLQLMTREFPALFKGIPIDRLAREFFLADDAATAEYKKGLSLEKTRLLRDSEFLKSLGLDQSNTPAIDAFYIKYYPTIKIFIAGAKPLIERLARTYRLGLISNGNATDQCQKLDNLGIRNLLSCTMFSEEIGIRKPDQRIFREAVKNLGRKTHECLYVGDSYENDVIGAKDAGMISCWFNRGQVPPPQTTVTPDFEISGLEQIIDILKCN
jgi:putative hydrolase of the HAD superfamily